ncbi:MAG: CsbD family protein [Pyrinomonadaceae bacterium]|nr:CsbD family protein [Pyrinomonadaceae bacterium]
MGRKSSGQDKGEGVVDKAKGRAKEAAGAVTGDKATKSEGRAEQTRGTTKEKQGKLKDLLKLAENRIGSSALWIREHGASVHRGLLKASASAPVDEEVF